MKFPGADRSSESNGVDVAHARRRDREHRTRTSLRLDEPRADRERSY